MKRIIIELEGEWVLAHRDDDALPAERLKAAFEGAQFTIEETSLSSVTVITDGDVSESRIKAIFLSVFPDEDAGAILNVSVEDVKAPEPVSETEKVEESAAQTAEENKPVAEEEGNKMPAPEVKEEPKPEEKGEDTVEGILGEINALVGAEEFKLLAGEVARVAPEIVRKKTYPVFYNRCYLFSIGEGYGLTTYLSLFARLLSVTKLRRMHMSPVVEEKLGAMEAMDAFEGVKRVLRDGDRNRVRILCIDISEWLGKTNHHYFREFLRTLEKSVEEFIIVFKVPFLEKDVLGDLNFSLNDLLSVRTVSFPPLSRNDLKTCAERELQTYGFKVSRNAWDYFQDRISEEKSDGKFYGLNTVKKVIRELIYNKLLLNAGKEKPNDLITRSDTKALCNSFRDPLSGMEQLNRLVGNEQVKKKVEEIIAQIEVSVRDNTSERPCIHMRFLGNPGTGKTTVARIIGKILKEKGLLRVGNFFEYAGRDFCGRYVGETAPKTASICRDAYGSVLFIDEAYSLFRSELNEGDYGREAIDTLIAEMENHRNDFVVIMAGYTDDMEKLLKANQGLASRMPYTIEFPNFTRPQLSEIFANMVKARFKYEDELLAAAEKYFLGLADEVVTAKEFSNARFVRNLFERTWAKAAMRCQLAKQSEIVLTKDDFDRACGEREFSFDVPKKSRLGF